MRPRTSRGFSLVETLVAAALLVGVAAGIYAGFGAIAKGAAMARLRNGALALANEKLEIVRGMDYADVGVVGGLPVGTLLQEESVVRGPTYDVRTTVRSIDLDFDGTIGGSPNDLSPADQKLVEIEVSCGRCGGEVIQLSTRVSPRALETSSGNGALFVQVLDSTGQPVEEADVTIVNDQASTTIEIEDRTGADGWLRIVDVPPGTMAYEISATKDGYSTSRTYAVGDPENPVPDLPHANVAAGQVTQVSFTIDRLAALEVVSRQATCERVGGVDFDLIGARLIGLDTRKYDEPHVTNGTGELGPLDLEWDDYSAEVTDGSWFLAGVNPPQPFSLAPAAEVELELVVTPRSGRALLVSVVDAGTGLPVSNATVELSRSGWSDTEVTGLGAALQTNWSGGPGAESAGASPTQFWSSNGNVNYSSTPGEVRLASTGSNYVSSGWIESSTFDTGTTTNLVSISWLPGDQPVAAGEGSVRFQLASLPEVLPESVWNFVGPSGTASTYYEVPGESTALAQNGDRYFRYRLYLETDDTSVTPAVSDVSVTYTLGCAPAGQVAFTGLTSATYTAEVSASGYESATVSGIDVTADWQSVTVELSP
jgi:type II secretory pathway pseudopilin PulG